MIQLHPVDNFDVKVNFWQEYPAFTAHRTFGQIYRDNRQEKLKESSLFMWLLSLCYDRKSPLYNQAEIDKWEAASENTFGKDSYMADLADNLHKGELMFPAVMDLRGIINEFEMCIDTPLGLSLRRLEKKLVERTNFITDTEYTMDHYKQVGQKNILQKGTADQLDKMFAATDKINSIVQSAMDALKASEAAGVTKGGQKESLSDGDKSF